MEEEEIRKKERNEERKTHKRLWIIRWRKVGQGEQRMNGKWMKLGRDNEWIKEGTKEGRTGKKEVKEKIFECRKNE